MATVRAKQIFAASVHEAEERWYDVDRRPEWVDGMGSVVEVRGPWPAAGSSLVWDSGPAGRGRVTERVLDHEPLQGQALEVEDQSIRARQWVSFTPAGADVEIELVLDYRIARRNPLTPLIDVLFVRRLMADSLERTLERFGSELRSAAQDRAR